MSTLFRQYASRVSFNVTLSRTQMWALYQVGNRVFGLSKSEREKLTGDSVCYFIPGVKALERMGLVTFTDPVTMTPKWSRDTYNLTAEGEHVLCLLELAELVPTRKPANIRKSA